MKKRLMWALTFVLPPMLTSCLMSQSNLVYSWTGLGEPVFDVVTKQIRFVYDDDGSSVDDCILRISHNYDGFFPSPFYESLTNLEKRLNRSLFGKHTRYMKAFFRDESLKVIPFDFETISDSSYIEDKNRLIHYIVPKKEGVLMLFYPTYFAKELMLRAFNRNIKLKDIPDDRVYNIKVPAKYRNDKSEIYVY